MLDAGMAEFETEMQAKARVRPRRVSTRRNAETDPSSPAGAADLARRIKAYWNACGFSGVVTEIVACGRHGEIPTYGVRSNLIGALPPQRGANGHQG
jgi:hypothetical protein